jgi:hypothetical protein
MKDAFMAVFAVCGDVLLNTGKARHVCRAFLSCLYDFNKPEETICQTEGVV